MKKKINPLSVEVGKLLAKQRKGKKLTQDAVAGTLRITRTSLSNIENGSQVLLLDVFYDLCVALNLSPSKVIDKAIHELSKRRSAQLEEIEGIVYNKDRQDGGQNG
jgi:transcriptional regulator with XRE-family HTH domain